LRERLVKIAEKTGVPPLRLVDAPRLPHAGEYIWHWFLSLHAGRGSGGFGPNPINITEIKAWSEIEGVRLTWWELKALRGMDAAYMAVATKQDDDAAPEPKEWDDLPEPERKAHVARHIKNVIRG
jgi:hypothetical protein